MSLKEELYQHARTHGPARIGLVGAGQMGTGLISQIEKMIGLRVAAVADIIPGRATKAYLEAGVAFDKLRTRMIMIMLLKRSRPANAFLHKAPIG